MFCNLCKRKLYAFGCKFLYEVVDTIFLISCKIVVEEEGQWFDYDDVKKSHGQHSTEWER